MDVLWGYLCSMKTGDGCNLKFKNHKAFKNRKARFNPTALECCQGARIQSRLNKTPYRCSLSLDGTLSSVLTVKMFNPEPCYKFEPPVDMLEKSKKVTWEYNKEHRKKVDIVCIFVGVYVMYNSIDSSACLSHFGGYLTQICGWSHSN